MFVWLHFKKLGVAFSHKKLKKKGISQSRVRDIVYLFLLGYVQYNKYLVIKNIQQSKTCNNCNLNKSSIEEKNFKISVDFTL